MSLQADATRAEPDDGCPMTNRTRALSAVAAAAVLAIGLTGCSVVHQQIGDAWAVTYRVDVDAPAGAVLDGVEVEGAASRGDAPEVRKVSDATTSTARGSGSSWQREVIVLAKDRASVRATPPAGRTATCHVLLDGKRDIATATSSAPGAPVTCRADTPSFD
jgi:hypothetical protein